MARRDNGAIIVGAGTKIGRNKASFSTYGSRVDLSGIGDGTIYSTGYGDLKNNGWDNLYTATFSGTSSSTPIVASAVVALQSFAQQEYNKTLTPLEIRKLLKETGTPQGTGGNIGPLPNIKAAMEKFEEEQSGKTPLQGDVLHRMDKIAIHLSKKHIELSGISSKEAHIEIYTLNGQRVFQGKVTISAGVGRVPLETISKGITIIKITAGQNRLIKRVLL